MKFKCEAKPSETGLSHPTAETVAPEQYEKAIKELGF